MSTTTPSPPPAAEQPPSPPRTLQVYPIPERTLRALAFTLPRPGDDEPASAWQEEVEVALDAISALDPHNPVELILVLQIIAATAAAQDAQRLAFEPGA